MPEIVNEKPRILYIGMVCTDAYVSVTGEEAFIGAASGKMSAVVSALRLTGRRSFLVSLPFVTQGPDVQTGRVCHADGFPAYFLPTRRKAMARKFYGIFAFAWFAIRRVRRRDIVLFYNHAIEYALALIILRLRRITVFQDIEDVPTVADRGLRGKLDKLGFALMKNLSSRRKVTVSNQVGRTLGLIDYKAVQGIAAQNSFASSEDRWELLNGGAPLRVHFGGTLVASTGLELFYSALKQLDAKAVELGRDITFVLSGTGDLTSIKVIAEDVKSARIQFELHLGVDRQSYFSLLDRCHVGLSLKSPYAELANSTFPSKVIEISSRGLALVSSRVSDVDEIFDGDEAWLLSQFNATELVEVLIYMANNPNEVRKRAVAGMARARELFDPLSVGRSLSAFLEVDLRQ